MVDFTAPPTAQNNREIILQAALAEVAERGYEAASIRSIARRAMVDPRLVRYYFTSKKNLAITAITECEALRGLTNSTRENSPLEQCWRDDPVGWQAFVSCGLSNDADLRAVFCDLIRDVIRSAITLYPSDDVTELKLQLLFGNVIGGWLLKDQDVAASEDTTWQMLFASIKQRVDELSH